MFKHPLLLCSTLLAITTLPVGAGAADIGKGQRLHNEHCMKCHDDGVYTREDRKIDSLTALTQQVKRCELSLGLTWFDDQVEDVVHYLNTTYYGFK